MIPWATNELTPSRSIPNAGKWILHDTGNEVYLIANFTGWNVVDVIKSIHKMAFRLGELKIEHILELGWDGNTVASARGQQGDVCLILSRKDYLLSVLSLEIEPFPSWLTPKC